MSGGCVDVHRLTEVPKSVTLNDLERRNSPNSLVVKDTLILSAAEM